MQALSRREENEVMDIAKAEAMASCHEHVKGFAECATGRTFSMAWACKPQLKAWHGCMRDYVTEERLDLLKLDYISNREERKQQSLIKNKKDRIESMKRHAGIKDAPVGPGR